MKREFFNKWYATTDESVAESTREREPYSFSSYKALVYKTSDGDYDGFVEQTLNYLCVPIKVSIDLGPCRNLSVAINVANLIAESMSSAGKEFGNAASATVLSLMTYNKR